MPTRCSSTGDGERTPSILPTSAVSASLKPRESSRGDLQAEPAGDAVDELLDRSADARVRHLHREQQRDAGGDPVRREQLLQRLRAQPPPVEEDDGARPHGVSDPTRHGCGQRLVRR